MKKGEAEAKIILERYGIQFDEHYYDDNSKESMPDLKYKEGRYLEVTHTKHNNNIFNSNRKYFQKSTSEQLKISQKASEAFIRINKSGYSRNEQGINQYKKDLKLLKNHMGYDPSSSENPLSEFKCDMPIIQFSANNILDEISKDKSKKYPKGDTDLFVFASIEEYKYFFDLLRESSWNGCGMNCINVILNSPFPTIYICTWDIHNQEYNTDNPNIRKLIKNADMSFRVMNLNH